MGDPVSASMKPSIFTRLTAGTGRGIPALESLFTRYKLLEIERQKLCVCASEYVLDPSIWYEPQQRTDDIQAQGDPLPPKGHRNGSGVQQQRQLAFPIAADRLFEPGVGTLRGNDQLLQYHVGDRRHQQHRTIERCWCSREMVRTHPARRERDEGQPEQEM